MTEPHRHASPSAIATRHKRAQRHPHRVVTMIEEGRPCLDLATRVPAAEPALAEAKRALIHDHIDYCLTEGKGHDMAEIMALTKLL